MTRLEKAQIILEAIDKHAPTCVDWNLDDLWLEAIMHGLSEIRAAELKETTEAATSRESEK